MADQVKVYLRTIAHSTSHADAQLAVRNIISAEFFKGKLKTRFTKKWFLHIQKWSLAYRPDCSQLLLSVVIESFISKHYQKYFELNIRYGDGFKKYAPGIPEF